MPFIHPSDVVLPMHAFFTRLKSAVAFVQEWSSCASRERFAIHLGYLFNPASLFGAIRFQIAAEERCDVDEVNFHVEAVSEDGAVPSGAIKVFLISPTTMSMCG